MGSHKHTHTHTHTNTDIETILTSQILKGPMDPVGTDCEKYGLIVSTVLFVVVQ